mgnify:CR=1 FL=1
MLLPSIRRVPTATRTGHANSDAIRSAITSSWSGPTTPTIRSLSINAGFATTRQLGEYFYWQTDNALGFRWTERLGSYTGFQLTGLDYDDVELLGKSVTRGPGATTARFSTVSPRRAWGWSDGGGGTSGRRGSSQRASARR